MKGLRTVYLTILTLVFYAFNNVLQHKSIIFPIPVNDFVLFVITVYLFFIEKVALKNGFLLIILSIFNVFQNPYNYELFLSSDQMTSLSESFILEIFNLLFIIAFVSECIFTFLKERNINFKILQSIILGFFISSLFFTNFILFILQTTSFLLFMVYYWRKKNQNEKFETNENHDFQLGFWLLFTFLHFSSIVTLYLN